LPDSTFIFGNFASGEYKLAIYKPKCAPVIKPISVEDEDFSMGEVRLWLYGDVNYDGQVKANDATQITRKVNGLGSVFTTGDAQMQAERLLAADVTGEGQIKANDAIQITRYVNGLGSVFSAFG
jgi:hypothetical protein